MPLRTWTFRDRKLDPAASTVHPIVGVEDLTRRLPWKRPRTFKAHLIGFRGIGNKYGNPFGHPPHYYCPAAVLRLENGIKRCFTRGTFVEEDEKYLLDLYLKEMDRTRAGLSRVKYELDERTKKEWPADTKPGEPGRLRVESDHFVWLSGSQHAPNEIYSPWINRHNREKARLYRAGSVTFAEDMWAYQEHAGVLMPFWDRQKRRKYAITVCGTYKDGTTWIPGYAGGGYGGCGIKHAGGGPLSLGLAHEWGHGLPLQTRVHGGGGEILADTYQLVDDPAQIVKCSNNVRRPWRNCLHGAYPTGLFYSVMGDDPNWGHAMVITLPVGKGEASFFHTLARVGEQRGLFANGIRGVGDMVGEFAARQAEFDCELQDGLRRGFISVKRNRLEPVDRKAGLYRVPWAEAPEAFGANVVRLVREKGAAKLTVDFRGFYDAVTYADWRACIVAVGSDGHCRYSPQWNKGVMAMPVRPGDRRFWLTVAGTPYALPPVSGGIAVFLVGRHAYRYPYEVKLTGCRPGTPHNMPGDTDDYGLAYLDGFRRREGGGLCVIPHPGDTPGAGILRKTIPALRAKLEAFNRETDRLVAAGKIAAGHYWFARRFRPHLAFLNKYATWMEDGIEGRRHPNGGGWVASSCEVAPTAYVGPDAMVLDGAKVLDHAAVEDFAVVRGPGAVVSGHARLGGQAYVTGPIKIGGHMRVRHRHVADDRPVLLNEVPLRPWQAVGEGGKLWANYAMDREEDVVFEDWFRYKYDWRVVWQFYTLNLSGYLHGRPAFVEDGDRRGFRFDGKTQYAEASRMLADLGAITVDIALKWEGGANQAIFDFGTSTKNRMVLSPAGASGKAELAITREGKTECVTAEAPLPKGKWATCRVEIDGRKIALWIDGRKAAEKASPFRPSNVYPPGADKRNFIAAARDATGHFKGVLDYVRVWHAVFDDFARQPAPRQHSSRRVCMKFVAACRKEYAGTAEAREKKIKARFDPAYAFYGGLREKRDRLLREIGAAPGGKAAHKPEHDWLSDFGWLAFSRHYNYNWGQYLRDRIAGEVGGRICHEDFGSLGKIHGVQNKRWRTRCDWDWRLRQEADGSIEKLPLLKKWLLKARGPVVREKPKGTK